MNDPYKVLNIPPSATDDEVKHAYRELARKYHPDNYHNNPLADLAQEKMKEINEAYDAIQKMRSDPSYQYQQDSESAYGNAYQRAYSQSAQGGAYTDYSGGSYGSTSAEQKFAQVRQLLNLGQYGEAELILDAMAAQERTAEWSYLKGIVFLHRGYTVEAQKFIDTACYMDPSNQEYADTKQRLRKNTSYTNGYNTTSSVSDCSMCNVCSSLLIADCCCECMGGDLIRCC